MIAKNVFMWSPLPFHLYFNLKRKGYVKENLKYLVSHKSSQPCVHLLLFTNFQMVHFPAVAGRGETRGKAIRL